jgi:hypothetical protein
MLKAELRYSILALLAALAVHFFLYTLYWLNGWERTDLPGGLAVIMVLTFIIYGAIYITYVKEKRDRLFSLLPVPAILIGFFRLLPAVVFWLGSVVLFRLATWGVIPRAERAIDLRLLSTTGFMFIVVACLVIYHDLSANTRFLRGSSRFWPSIVWLVYIVLAYLLFTLSLETHGFLSSLGALQRFLFYSPAGCLLLLGLGSGLIGLSAWVFSRRKSYAG